MTTTQAVADRNSRVASELRRIRASSRTVVRRATTWRATRRQKKPTPEQSTGGDAGSTTRCWWCQQIAKSPHLLDDIDIQLLADTADKNFNRVRVAIEILVVEMLDQFGARDHAPRVVHQIRQQAVFMRRHLDWIASYADAAGAGVERNRPAGQLRLGMAGRAAQQRANARQNLFEVKRLCDIVVGAGVKTLNLVAPAIARGEDQDRHRAAVASPGFQHRDAVHLGQTDIEHHRVIRLAIAEEVPLFAVEGAVNHISGVRQRRRELAIEIRIILDDK